MAEQKTTDIRRILADVENNAKDLRDGQRVLENQLLSVPVDSAGGSRQGALRFEFVRRGSDWRVARYAG
jgi:hypothetical protein